MRESRFSNFWGSDSPVTVRADAVPTGGAFVLLPCPMPAHCWAQAEMLYRFALEQAQAQVARERRARRLAVSLN